jgi:tetratricopeptide (TPR) repeat protein
MLKLSHISARKSLSLIAFAIVVSNAIPPLKAQADQLNASVERGVSQMGQSNYDAAVRSFNEAIGMNQENPTAFLKRGICLFELGKYELAIKDFNEVLQQDKDNTDAHLFKGASQAKLGRDPLAIKSFALAIKCEPGLADAYKGRAVRGGARLRTNGESSRSYPGKDEMLIKRSGNYIWLGSNDNGLADFRAALNLDGGGNGPAEFNGGVAYSGINTPEETANDLSNAIKANPKNVETRQARATVYMGLQDPKKAIEDLNDAIEMDPRNDASYYKRAKAYEQTGNITKAVEDYTRALDINPQSRYYLARAYAYHQLKKPDLAKEDIKNARAVDATVPKKLVFPDQTTY